MQTITIMIHLHFNKDHRQQVYAFVLIYRMANEELLKMFKMTSVISFMNENDPFQPSGMYSLLNGFPSHSDSSACHSVFILN